jgi:cystathionine gamma-synthase
MHIDTILAQIGNRKEKATGAINFPIYHSTAYQHPALGESTGFDYTRTLNPTRLVLEEAIAALERGDRGFAVPQEWLQLESLCHFLSRVTISLPH